VSQQWEIVQKILQNAPASYPRACPNGKCRPRRSGTVQIWKMNRSAGEGWCNRICCRCSRGRRRGRRCDWSCRELHRTRTRNAGLSTGDDVGAVLIGACSDRDRRRNSHPLITSPHRRWARSECSLRSVRTEHECPSAHRLRIRATATKVRRKVCDKRVARICVSRVGEGDRTRRGRRNGHRCQGTCWIRCDKRNAQHNRHDCEKSSEPRHQDPLGNWTKPSARSI